MSQKRYVDWCWKSNSAKPSVVNVPSGKNRMLLDPSTRATLIRHVVSLANQPGELFIHQISRWQSIISGKMIVLQEYAYPHSP